MGWIQARPLVGLWRGKFIKRVLITLLEKPTTKTHRCKMETDGWLQFSIYFSGMGVNVVPCRCSKGSCCLCKTLVSITVGRNMEHIQIWLKQSWQSIGLWERLFFIPCFYISLSSLELKFSLMKSYCSLSYSQSLLLGYWHCFPVNILPNETVTEFLFKTIRVTKPTCLEEFCVLCRQVKQKMISQIFSMCPSRL